jgi:hypothetical protein
MIFTDAAWVAGPQAPTALVERFKTKRAKGIK